MKDKIVYLHTAGINIFQFGNWIFQASNTPLTVIDMDQ